MSREDMIRYMNNRIQNCRLEIMDVFTGERRILKRFDKVIEAPNWTKDGRQLIYNSEGAIPIRMGH